MHAEQCAPRLFAMLAALALLAACAGVGDQAGVSCPRGTEQVDAFTLNGTAWLACEDWHAADGALALVSAAGDAEYFSKTFEPYVPAGPHPGYYLGGNVTWPGRKNTTLTGKAALVAATTNYLEGLDLLGIALLNQSLFSHLTHQLVEATLPPIAGLGTFVSSRSSSVDTSIGPSSPKPLSRLGLRGAHS